MTTQLKLADLRTDGGTQPRAAIDPTVVAEYAADIEAGAPLPPVTAFHDGTDYWLADGFHRRAAYQQLGAHTLPADVRQGTRRDAVLYSTGANATHGLRRTNADKRRAIETLLRDPEWVAWSDHEIARRTGTDHKTVGSVRRALGGTGEIPQSTLRKGGDGRLIETANIGSAPAVPPPTAPAPAAPSELRPAPAPVLTPAAPAQTLVMSPPAASPAFTLSVRILPGDARPARRCMVSAGNEGLPPVYWKACTLDDLDEQIAAALELL